MHSFFNRRFFVVLIIALLGLSSIPSLGEAMSVSTEEEIKEFLPAGWPKSGLLIFPEAGRTPYLEALMSAKEKIELAAYKLSDPKIVETLRSVRKANPGMKIDVLIQPETFSHEKSGNVASPSDLLRENGINV